MPPGWAGAARQHRWQTLTGMWGDALGISPRTVGRHVGSILDKLGPRNRRVGLRRLDPVQLKPIDPARLARGRHQHDRLAAVG